MPASLCGPIMYSYCSMLSVRLKPKREPEIMLFPNCLWCIYAKWNDSTTTQHKTFATKTPKLPEKTRSSATAEIARVVPHKPLPITRLRGLHFCRWQNDAAGFESCRIVWNNTKYRPFNVTRGHLFLYRSKARICLTSHGFRVIATIWSNGRFCQRLPLFNCLVRGEPVNCGCESWPQKTTHTSTYWIMAWNASMTGRKTDGKNCDSLAIA